MATDTSLDWTLIWAVIAAMAIGFCTYLFLHPRTTKVTQTQWQTVTQLETVHDVQRVYVPGPKQVVVLNKPAVAKALDMPWLVAPAPAPAAAAAPEQVAAGDALTPTPAASASADPAPVAGDPQDLQVTTTADIPESDAGSEAVGILNTKTGESTIVIKEKPLEFFAFENRGELGAWYGYNNHQLPAMDLTAQWSVLRIMQTHLAVRATGGNGGASIQGGLLYQW